MKRALLLFLVLLSGHVHAWTAAKGYGDANALVRVYIPAGSCSATTPAPNWDVYSLTDPTPACITGTVIKKGVLTFAVYVVRVFWTIRARE